jgi:hypothetical protein
MAAGGFGVDAASENAMFSVYRSPFIQMTPRIIPKKIKKIKQKNENVRRRGIIYFSVYTNWPKKNS